ncbi:hypothetical protein ACHAWC_008826 [Mediolabrus comicus]
MMQYITEIKNVISSLLRYLHRNAWTIIFILAGGYFLFDNFIHPFIHQYQTKQSYKQATDPNRVAVLSPDMRRVRAKQQQLAEKRAAEAKEERKQHEKAERERKRVKSPEEERWDKLGGKGKKLGSEDSSNAELRQRR